MEVRKIEPRVNWQIRVRKIRVIDENGKQLGIMTPKEGMRIAQQKGLDLVEVAPKASPPVCKIMDYGKYMYEQKKRAREAKKHQKTAELKEIRFKYDIADHDYQFKLRHAEKFLRSGKRVKISIIFRGREVVHADLGRKMLEKFAADLSHVGSIEQYPRMDGRMMSILLVPNPEMTEKGDDEDAEDEKQQKR
ncbi:translation initiation factor IF-3 [Candidatus Poribacteria bacterium]|nr:translation initiation factor IF-3 [Candidatus Poribacteria bacterium]